MKKSWHLLNLLLFYPTRHLYINIIVALFAQSDAELLSAEVSSVPSTKVKRKEEKSSFRKQENRVYTFCIHNIQFPSSPWLFLANTSKPDPAGIRPGR